MKKKYRDLRRGNISKAGHFIRPWIKGIPIDFHTLFGQSFLPIVILYTIMKVKCTFSIQKYQFLKFVLSLSQYAIINKFYELNLLFCGSF